MAQQSVDFKPKVDDTTTKSDKQTDAPKEQPATQTSIFGCLNVSGQNLFANTGPSLFSTANTGLFSNPPGQSLFTAVDLAKPTTGSLFGLNFTQQPAPKSDESDDGEGEGQEDNKSQDDEPKELVMKYEYSSNTEQIVKISVDKFRKNTNDVLEKGSITLEKAKESDSYFFIYRNNIQQLLYSGQLVKNVSKLSPLGQKAENVLLKAVSRVDDTKESKDAKDAKDKPKTQFNIDNLKIMFSNKEGAEQFKMEFEKLFK